MTADPWANLRGVPVPIRERCGATTKTGEPCRADGELCGLHPRVRRFPYKRHRLKPDGRTDRARRNRAEMQRAVERDLDRERRQLDRVTAERIEHAGREHSNPPETPGSQCGSPVRSQSAAPPARQPTRGRERQPPPRNGAPPYRYRSARLRYLNPDAHRPAERDEDEPPEGPPDGGEPLCAAA